MAGSATYEASQRKPLPAPLKLQPAFFPAWWKALPLATPEILSAFGTAISARRVARGCCIATVAGETEATASPMRR